MQTKSHTLGVRSARTRDSSGLDIPAAIVLLLWSLALLLSPVYVFKSGIPQPSDWLFILMLVCLFVFGRFQPGSRWDERAGRVLGGLGIFVVYSVFVNITWALILSGSRQGFESIPISMLLSSSYYAFNLCVAAGVASMLRWLNTKFIICSVFVLVVSGIVQAIVAFQTGSINSDGERTTAFFENPNQLGYFAVLNASLLLVLARSGKLNRFSQLAVLLGYLALLYLAIVSSSRAGIAGIGLACVLMYIDNLRRGIVFAVVLIVVLGTGFFASVSETLVDRTLDLNRGFVGELTYRGYDRLWNHPHYLLFGAGEGEYERFESHSTIELHSTPGTLLFCYGIIGFVLFFKPIVSIVRELGLSVLLLLLPVLVYGLTHQGLRQSEFWMLILLAGCLGNLRSVIDRETQNETTDLSIENE